MDGALVRRLSGFEDSRSKKAIYSRGKNIYKGGSYKARKVKKPNSQVSQRTIYRRLNGK